VLQRQPVFQTPIWGKVGHISGVVGEHASPVRRLSSASIFAVPKVGSNPRALANAKWEHRSTAVCSSDGRLDDAAKRKSARCAAHRRKENE
jgi:hypothetical protein